MRGLLLGLNKFKTCPSTATVIFHTKGKGADKKYNKNEMRELFSTSPSGHYCSALQSCIHLQGPACTTLGSGLHCTLL